MYFSRVGGKLASALPHPPLIQRNKLENHNAEATESNMICSIDFDEKLFERALLKMQPGKANGQDSIAAKELKMIGSELSY